MVPSLARSPLLALLLGAALAACQAPGDPADPAPDQAGPGGATAGGAAGSSGQAGGGQAGALSGGSGQSGGSAGSAAGGAGAAGGTAGAAPVEVTYPLEVLGLPPATATLVFDLSASELAALPPDGLALTMTLHNVVEKNACALSVNGAEAIDLGAKKGPFLRARGEVTTGTIALPAAGLVAGRNELTLAYTRQVPNVSGFRVLALRLARGGAPVEVRLASAPPAVTLRTDAASIARGGAFFREVSRDGGPACGRCHTDNGEDVKYFSFSSRSIVERAMFHLFSRDEAEDIASYIQALDVPSPGTVYSPPFQPGEGNHASAGAGLEAVLPDDQALADSLGGVPALGAVPAWDWAASVDTFRQPVTVQLPTWFRWMPRELRDEWFTASDGRLAKAEAALAQEPTVASAQAFQNVANELGKTIMLQQHDDVQRIDLMRFAAVKLWDWSRKQGFDQPHHGFPDGTPGYPYEVGFAFFEAIKNKGLFTEGAEQVMQWWTLQLAVYPGRGLSDGRRPLNFQDVQSAAVSAGAGPAQLAWLHLYGSWEESRGTMADGFGSDLGPVRLLDTMMTLDPGRRAAVLRRFLDRQADFVASGGQLSEAHHALLAKAWSAGCSGLAASTRDELRAHAAEAAAGDLSACP